MVRLTHYPDDVCAWVIETWERGFMRRRNACSRWFNTREQAELFGRDHVKQFERSRNVAHIDSKSSSR
jgi:hypothetical protein